MLVKKEIVQLSVFPFKFEIKTPFKPLMNATNKPMNTPNIFKSEFSEEIFYPIQFKKKGGFARNY